MDNQFDYSICNQVLEHSDNPEQFISELTRVSNSGYIETPSLFGEFLFPKKSHKWIILIKDSILIFFKKEKIEKLFANDYGYLFLNYMPYQSLAYKILYHSEQNLFVNRFEWKDSIDYIIDPDNSVYNQYFSTTVSKEIIEDLFCERSKLHEFIRFIRAIYIILRDKIITKMQREIPLDIDEYFNLNKIG